MVAAGGDVFSRIQAVGTLAAILFGIIAIWFAYHTSKVNSDRGRAQKSRERKAQAALVSTWWGESKDGQWGVVVRNASETQVYQVFLTALGLDDRPDEAKVYRPVVPPSSDAVCFPIDDELSAQRASARRVKLSFTDATGVRWLRNEYGVLTECWPKLSVSADARRGNALDKFKKDFKATYGADVTFQTSPPAHSQKNYVADLQGNKGIDALVCPHDWIGDLIAHDVIEPTLLCKDHRAPSPHGRCPR